MDLTDDAGIRDLLAGGSVRWHRLVHQRVVDSTNDLARRLLAEGEEAGLVVVADRQTAGRGRRGRRWVEREGRVGPTNLSVSATVLPVGEPGTWVPLAAGLAVVDCFAAAGARAVLKWPNDVLLGGHKAAGILVEQHTLRGVDLLIVGCGLDVDWRDVDRGQPAGGNDWTSLAEELGRSVDRAALVSNLLAALDRWLAIGERDPAELLAAYRASCDTLGREVRVMLPGGESLAGRAVDLDGAGRLVVDGPSGRRVLGVGDVEHLRADHPV